MSYAATTTKKFLDAEGLAYFARKLNNYPTNDVIEAVVEGVQDALDEKVDLLSVGAQNGVASLGADGKIPSSQLPSYVDDVLEYLERDRFPLTGESGKIYVDLETNKTYRWSGSTYVEISASIVLGTTSETAYRGDYGEVAYRHAIAKGTAVSYGLYKFVTNSEGHVTSVTPVTKTDIVNLGIPASNTSYRIEQDQLNPNKFTFIGTDDTETEITIPDRNTWIAMTGATSSAAGTAGYVPSPPSTGYNTKYLCADGTWAVPHDTTYEAITNNQIDALFI